MAHIIDNLPGYIALGQEGEAGAVEIEFDISAWVALYPAGSYAVSWTAPGSTTAQDDDEGSVTRNGETLTWVPGTSVLAVDGQGTAVVRCAEGDKVKCSRMVSILIHAGHPATI